MALRLAECAYWLRGQVDRREHEVAGMGLETRLRRRRLGRSRWSIRRLIPAVLSNQIAQIGRGIGRAENGVPRFTQGTHVDAGFFPTSFGNPGKVLPSFVRRACHLACRDVRGGFFLGGCLLRSVRPSAHAVFIGGKFLDPQYMVVRVLLWSAASHDLNAQHGVTGNGAAIFTT